MSHSHILQFFTNCSPGAPSQSPVPQEQADPARISLRATSPASKPSPGWTPLSTRAQVLPGACSGISSPRRSSLPQASSLSQLGSSVGCSWTLLQNAVTPMSPVGSVWPAVDPSHRQLSLALSDILVSLHRNHLCGHPDTKTLPHKPRATFSRYDQQWSLIYEIPASN